MKKKECCWLVIISVFLVFGCQSLPTKKINFLQDSLWITAKVSRETGNVTLKGEQDVYWYGKLSIKEILVDEGLDADSPDTVQIIQMKGVYFLTAEGFSNVWHIAGMKDGATAKAGKIVLPVGDKLINPRWGIGVKKIKNRDTKCVILKCDNQRDNIYINYKGKIIH